MKLIRLTLRYAGFILLLLAFIMQPRTKTEMYLCFGFLLAGIISIVQSVNYDFWLTEINKKQKEKLKEQRLRK